MKRFVSLLLAVLMTAALFTGCAKQPQTPETPQEAGRHHPGGRPEGPHVYGPGEAAGRRGKPENRQRH